MSIKFLFLGGGGVFWVFGGGGGGVPILFLWARGFFWFTGDWFKEGSMTDVYMLKALGRPNCSCGISPKVQHTRLFSAQYMPGTWEHQNRASPFASDFHHRLRYRREFRNGNQLCPFQSQRKSPFACDFWSQAKSRILGPKKIARFCGGAVKIAATAAENRAILVHSGVPAIYMPPRSGAWLIKTNRSWRSVTGSLLKQHQLASAIYKRSQSKCWSSAAASLGVACPRNAQQCFIQMPPL